MKKQIKNRFKGIVAIYKGHTAISEEMYDTYYHHLTTSTTSINKKKTGWSFTDWIRFDNFETMGSPTWVAINDYDLEDGGMRPKRFSEKINSFLYWIATLVKYETGKTIKWVDDRYFSLVDDDNNNNVFVAEELLSMKHWFSKYSLSEIASLICDDIEKHNDK